MPARRTRSAHCWLRCALLLACTTLVCSARRRVSSSVPSLAGADDPEAGAAAARWQLARNHGHLTFRQRPEQLGDALDGADAVPSPSPPLALLPSSAVGLPPCALVVHFHVQRTGGTYVRAHMARSAARKEWEFVGPNAFRAAWPPLRNAVLGGPAASCSSAWANRRLLVEVQANSNYRLFMDEVLPYATELRKRYAACNCTSALSVVLREPMAQAVSFYRHTLLRDSAHAPSKPPPSLPEWLAKTHDPQTRALLGYNVRTAEIGGKPFHTCTPLAQARALHNLQGFDVVGVTERLDAFIAALGERTGWRETLSQETLGALLAAHAAQSYEGADARWQRSALTADELAALAEHTACDASVYAAALAALNADVPATVAFASPTVIVPAQPPLQRGPLTVAPAADVEDDARRAAALAALREQHRAEAAERMSALPAAAPGGALPSCALLVFYHVAKTGGAYVRFLMQASRAAGDWQFDEPEDFRSATWPFLRDRVLANATGGAPADDVCSVLHAHGRLLAEVHANAGFALWARSVAPVLPALRARYAGCGCRLTTSILLREPLSAAVSAYRFFPLKQLGAGVAPPLEAWIRDNHDPQTKAVLGFNLLPRELPGGQPFASCSLVAEEGALANLRAFDVVGVTDSMPAWLHLLAARSGWVAPRQLVNAAGEPTDDERIMFAARNAQSYDGEDAHWQLERLPAATLQALQQHTECDASLYAAAQALFADSLAQAGLAADA